VESYDSCGNTSESWPQSRNGSYRACLSACGSSSSARASCSLEICGGGAVSYSLVADAWLLRSTSSLVPGGEITRSRIASVPFPCSTTRSSPPTVYTRISDVSSGRKVLRKYGSGVAPSLFASRA